MKLSKEQIEEIINDQGNTLFGIPFSEIRGMIYDYQTKGVDPYRILQLQAEITRLKEFEWKYKELCK
jgi:hypothetical protein